eukprot:g963.t1
MTLKLAWLFFVCVAAAAAAGDLSEWLSSLKLQEYQPQLEELGIESTSDLEFVQEGDLSFMKRVHKRRLLKELAEFKTPQDDDKVEDDEGAEQAGGDGSDEDEEEQKPRRSTKKKKKKPRTPAAKKEEPSQDAQTKRMNDMFAGQT